MGDEALVPRSCHIVRWPDFNGYGFNLHAEKGKAGQFIGKVDEGSPAEAAGLKQGDRIVEVNGVNIGNENHQQVVSRIKAGGEETRLLVVDSETDALYKEEKKIVKGDLPEVLHLTAVRENRHHHDHDHHHDHENYDEEPVAVIGSVANGAPPNMDDQHRPRLCKMCKWPDFDGYGFNLHAEKDKPGQYIGSVDPDSPAETGGLREGDRIIEVNGENIEAQSHNLVIQRIKAGGERTTMLVVDRAADDYYKSRGVTVSSSMPHVLVFSTPPRGGTTEIVTSAYISSYVDSAPEPEPVHNGTDEDDNDVTQAVAAFHMADDEEEEEDDAGRRREQQFREEIDFHPYETVAVPLDTRDSASPPPTPSPSPPFPLLPSCPSPSPAPQQTSGRPEVKYDITYCRPELQGSLDLFTFVGGEGRDLDLEAEVQTAVQVAGGACSVVVVSRLVASTAAEMEEEVEGKGVQVAPGGLTTSVGARLLGYLKNRVRRAWSLTRNAAVFSGPAAEGDVERVEEASAWELIGDGPSEVTRAAYEVVAVEPQPGEAVEVPVDELSPAAAAREELREVWPERQAEVKETRVPEEYSEVTEPDTILSPAAETVQSEMETLLPRQCLGHVSSTVVPELNDGAQKAESDNGAAQDLKLYVSETMVAGVQNADMTTDTSLVITQDTDQAREQRRELIADYEEPEFPTQGTQTDPLSNKKAELTTLCTQAYLFSNDETDIPATHTQAKARSSKETKIATLSTQTDPLFNKEVENPVPTIYADFLCSDEAEVSKAITTQPEPHSSKEAIPQAGPDSNEREILTPSDESEIAPPNTQNDPCFISDVEIQVPCNQADFESVKVSDIFTPGTEAEVPTGEEAEIPASCAQVDQLPSKEAEIATQYTQVDLLTGSDAEIPTPCTQPDSLSIKECDILTPSTHVDPLSNKEAELCTPGTQANPLPDKMTEVPTPITESKPLYGEAKKLLSKETEISAPSTQVEQLSSEEMQISAPITQVEQLSSEEIEISQPNTKVEQLSINDTEISAPSTLVEQLSSEETKISAPSTQAELLNSEEIEVSSPGVTAEQKSSKENEIFSPSPNAKGLSCRVTEISSPTTQAEQLSRKVTKVSSLSVNAEQKKAEAPSTETSPGYLPVDKAETVTADIQVPDKVPTTAAQVTKGADAMDKATQTLAAASSTAQAGTSEGPVEEKEDCRDSVPALLQTDGTSNGINGRIEEPSPMPAKVIESRPEPVRQPVHDPEPEPAVIKSTVSVPAKEGDPILHLSAAEMKERLRSKKKQDPRLQKTSFEAKYKMFERM